MSTKRSKGHDRQDNLRNKDDTGRRKIGNDEDEDQVPRKRKISGKRVHRKKTLKEELWEDLSGR